MKKPLYYTFGNHMQVSLGAPRRGAFEVPGGDFERGSPERGLAARWLK